MYQQYPGRQLVNRLCSQHRTTGTIHLTKESCNLAQEVRLIHQLAVRERHIPWGVLTMGTLLSVYIINSGRKVLIPA